jgi:AraC-like DNA-binding protein
LKGSVRFEHARRTGGVNYHFHPEYELLLGSAVHGLRLVGDNIEEYDGESLVLIGPALAHGWIHEQPQTFTVVTFTRESLGLELLAKPEMRAVRRLLDRADRGVLFGPKTTAAVRDGFARMRPASDASRLALVMLVLSRMAAARDARVLASERYVPSRVQQDHQWFARALAVLHQSVDSVPPLAAMASRVGVSVPTFTRLFRRMSGMSYVQYVNHWRVGRAKRLLRETGAPILDVALASGYANLSHFNRQFLRLAGASPREYRNRSERLAD